jgi:hypothetical protein
MGEGPRRSGRPVVATCIGFALITGCTAGAVEGSASPTATAPPSTTSIASPTYTPTIRPSRMPQSKSAKSATPKSTRSVHITAVELWPEDPSPGGQYVVLENSTEREVDVGCWVVRSTAKGKSANVVASRPLAARAAIRLFPDRVLFGPADVVLLVDRQGREVDRTPEIVDHAGDDQLWFADRNGGTWRFGRQLRLPSQVADGRLVTESGGC